MDEMSNAVNDAINARTESILAILDLCKDLNEAKEKVKELHEKRSK